MNDKYKNAMSKINASEELKNNIILNMREEENKHTVKAGKIIKVRQWFIRVAAVAGIVTCGGIAYAGIKGKTIGRIKFSENYEIYEEEIENKYVEKDGNKVSLKSMVCDEGFLVLHFDISLNDKETEGLRYLSFNDKIITTEGGYKHTNLSGANYNLIIDGKEYWLKGSSENELQEINEREYEFYQIWFLPNEVLGKKEEFTITLKDIVLSLGDDVKLISMDDKMEVKVSKKKALENTTKFNVNNATVTYKTLSKSIEKVYITPLQNIVKISNVLNIVDAESLVYTPSDNYIGNVTYKVYDQNGNEISEFDTKSYLALQYADGATEEFDLDLGYSIDDRDFTNVKEISTEYIVIEKNENIKELNIDIFESNDYYETVRKIGTYHIDLTKQKASSENKDEIISSKKEEIIQDLSNHTIDISEIKEFTIKVPKNFKWKYSIIKRDDGANSWISKEEFTAYYLDFGYKRRHRFIFSKGGYR